MKIIFNSDNHEYLADGVVKPSVTQIVSWYFNKDLSVVPQQILINAQNRGIEIHEDVDLILQGKEPKSVYADEILAFARLKKKHKIKADHIEEIIYGCTEFGDYCGTLDLYDSKSKILYDIKTTSDTHIEEWKAQMNMYKYCLESIGYKVKKLKVIWLPKIVSKSDVIDINIEKDEYVENIVRCYYSKERPQREIVELDSLPSTQIQQLSVAFETIKRIESEIENMKEKILVEMKSRGIEKFECPQFVIVLNKSHERISFDSKKFQAENPEEYEKYLKRTMVKDSIRINLKGGK